MKIKYTLLSGACALALLGANPAPAEGNEMHNKSRNETSAIKELPTKGQVNLSGTVASVDSNKSFILRDSNGNTIDVHANSNLNLEEDDYVNVSGRIQSEALGMGEEIVEARLTSFRTKVR